MLNPQELFNAIQEQASQILPDIGKSAQEDIGAQIKIIVGGILTKLDLVSREEFDTQQAVLEKTRAKLEQLEKDFSLLESKLSESES